MRSRRSGALSRRLVVAMSGMITYLPVGRFDHRSQVTGHRSQITGHRKVRQMKVLVAGATGAVGGALVPALVRAGHDVVGTTRSSTKGEQLRALGAEALVLDILDREATVEAVARVAPDAIVHQATALTGAGNLKKFDQEFALTNRLRTEGTDNLLAAGARRFIAQSYAGWPY